MAARAGQRRILDAQRPRGIEFVIRIVGAESPRRADVLDPRGEQRGTAVQHREGIAADIGVVEQHRGNRPDRARAELRALDPGGMPRPEQVGPPRHPLRHERERRGRAVPVRQVVGTPRRKGLQQLAQRTGARQILVGEKTNPRHAIPSKARPAAGRRKVLRYL